MSALPQPSFLSAEEYLESERRADAKSDYLNGIVVAMAGAKHRHNLVVGNTFRHIANALVDRPCVIYGSDMKVRIEKANHFRYPDLSAVCGPIDFYDATEDSYCNPQFIAEVLSDSTCAIDRRDKFAAYRLIPTFNEYLIIEPDRLEVELHRLSPESGWTCASFTGAEDSIILESIGVTLRLGGLYEKVVFPA
jgi:Uma2 family endonuclease